MKRPALVPGMMLTFLALAGCEHHDETQIRPIRPLSMPNPASLYCVKRGGTLTIKNTEKGQTGYCTLPDGTVEEQWALFRKNYPKQ
jgi:putative hemolysin